MSISPDRAATLLNEISLAMPDVLKQAVDIALHQSLEVAAQLRELESHGYRVTAEVTYNLVATPVELIFDQSISEHDARFLQQLRIGVAKAEPPGPARTNTKGSATSL